MARRQVGWPYKKEFTCHRCGNCCRGDGFVEMSEDDIVRAAWLLDITEEEFVAKYCEHSPGGGEIFLKDQQDDLQSCIFLIEDDQGLFGCRIHNAKPEQCQGFPFNWRPRDVMNFCDGMRALEGLPPTSKRKTMSGK